MSFFDLTLNNVRDLIKAAKKERIKLHSVQAVQFADKVFASKEEKAASQVPKRQTEEEKGFMAANIEKEFIEIQEAQANMFGTGGSGASKSWVLKNLSEFEVKADLTETAYFLDKCMDQSRILNEKLGYVSNIRSVQFISLNI